MEKVCAVESSISILDGGLATELERNGFSFLNNPLWSASFLQDNTEALIKVHKSYLDNHADIITTASYQASIPGFQKHLGLSVEESKDLIKLSVHLAKKARDELNSISGRGKGILIAGSVGPYGAALADGSEYSGNYCDKITHEELIEFHRPRIECLVEAGTDILAFETIPAVKEAEALLKLLKDFSGTKAWLSFSCQSLHSNVYGDDIKTAMLNAIERASPGQLLAIGVNCCPPECVESLLTDISAVSSKYPLIVYPNSGEKWDNKIGWTGSRFALTDKYLATWTSKFPNLSIIGGCCRTTPEDISNISKFLQSQNL